MKTEIPRKYYLVPVAYIIIIAALLAFEFTGTVKIEERLKDLTVTAMLPARQGGNGQSVQSIRLEMDGFGLSFDRQTPIEFRLSTGRSVYAYLTEYAIVPGSVEIVFGKHLSLIVHTGSAQKRFEVETDLEEAAEFVLPYSTTVPIQAGDHGLPLLTLVNSGRTSQNSTVVALPPGSIIDWLNSAFILKSETGSYSDLYVTRFESADAAHTAYWFESQYQFPLVQDYYGAISRYIDNAYLGWTSRRYRESNGTWLMPDGSRSFDETLLTAALSEASRRNELESKLGVLRSAAVLYQDRTTWLSAPHLGDIVNKGRDISSGDADLIQQINSLIAQESADVFSIPNLLEFAADRASSSVFQNLADFAARINIDTLSTSNVVNMLQIYRESINVRNPLTVAFTPFRNFIESRLLPSLMLTDRGLFLGSGPQLVNIADSLRGGLILAAIGETEANSLYEKIGKELTASALAFADENSFLPETVHIEEGVVSATDGSVRPEEIYSFLTGSAFYPRHVSLSESAGQGIWAWTVCENFNVRQTGSGLSISFEYPEKGVHHFILKGIQPFTAISFFGIQWKSDPRFQYYGSGWLYSEADNALYVKITHSDVREELVIRY